MDWITKHPQLSLARAQAEGLLYSDLGNYLIERTEAKLFHLGPREIRALASALIRPETVSESHDGKSFTFTAKVATDPTALVKALNSLRNDSQRISDLVEIGRGLEAALIKIDDLQQETIFPGRRCIRGKAISSRCRRSHCLELIPRWIQAPHLG